VHLSVASSCALNLVFILALTPILTSCKAKQDTLFLCVEVLARLGVPGKEENTIDLREYLGERNG
jgi:hypothetical protein